MRNILYSFLALFLLLFGCNSSSDAIPKADKVSFTIFHSNDIIGYLKPCG
ncbi:MAG: hypothetical protein GWP06_13805 [Actinobacteria bacterium]|nr:hypothetical protein [Actinomycetota bacterium]